MITFLKTVLIVLLIYFGLKFLVRLLAPYILKYIAKKAGQKFERAFEGFQHTNASPSEEGKVTVDKMPRKNKAAKTVGEYVDYEEVD